MKKLAVIAAMTLLSVATMTACGNKENKTNDNETKITDQDSTNDTDTNVDNNTDNSNTDDSSADNNNTNDSNTDADNVDDSYGGVDPDGDADYSYDKDADNDTNAPEDNVDGNVDKEDNTNVNDENVNDDKQDKKDKNKGENDQKELVETGKEPDFKLNKKGCFNGSYEGNDGCTYKFTKKGKLIITSDSETLKYEYTLSDDVLSMIAEDGSFGTSRQITLLEDGTYLLDDKMGTQVILTYVE